MLEIVLIVFLLLMNNAFGVDCDRHPIYCDIRTVHQNIDSDWAMKVSNKIHKYTRKYNLDAKLFVSILRQESHFRLVKSCYKDSKGYQNCDYGIGQIWEVTAKHKKYRFDLEKLLTDLDYSVESSAKVLYNIKKRYEKKYPEDWWLIYNCGTKKPLTRITCQRYKKAVMEHREKI